MGAGAGCTIFNMRESALFNQLNDYFLFFVQLGAPAMMFFIITALAMILRTGFLTAMEGGLRMALALTGMAAVISLLSNAFSPALTKFVETTGVSLSVTDLGWAPLATMTWSSIYTLYFALICIATNLLLLFFNKTKTLNVDLFNIWNMSVLGLLIKYYSDSMLVTTLFVMMIYMLTLLNSDVLKKRINDLLGYDENNVTTTAHASLLIAPPVFMLDRLLSRLLPQIDAYDFDAEKLNEKIGFWGSKFAIGVYLGLFVGLLGRLPGSEIFALAFTAGVALELFSIVGMWFAPAIRPLSVGISSLMQRYFQGRKIYVAIDWPILAARPEFWAVCNILAPVLLVIAVFLPGNSVLPLGGILLTVSAPALLVITRGRIMRMTLIGIILIPLFLWAATLIASFVTDTSLVTGSYPIGLEAGQLFSSVGADPLEKMLAVVIGVAVSSRAMISILCAIVALGAYVLMFAWYFRRIRQIDHQS